MVQCKYTNPTFSILETEIPLSEVDLVKPTGFVSHPLSIDIYIYIYIYIFLELS